MRIYKISGKTWRDDKNNVLLYHGSPDRLGSLKPKSKFHGYSGMFFSPDYKNMAMNWAEFVIGKKGKKHPLIRQRRNMIDRLHVLDEITNKTPEQEDEYRMLDNKVADMVEAYSKITDQRYSRIYVHKVECPKSIYKASRELMQKAMDEGYKKGNLGFWTWGDQVFIPENMLKHLTIVSIEEWDEKTVTEKSRNEWTSRYMTYDKPISDELADPNAPVPQWDPDRMDRIKRERSRESDKARMQNYYDKIRYRSVGQK